MSRSRSGGACPAVTNRNKPCRRRIPKLILRINMTTTAIGRRKLLPILPALALRLKPPAPSGEPLLTSEICTAFKNLRDTALQSPDGYEPPASEQETCW